MNPLLDRKCFNLRVLLICYMCVLEFSTCEQAQVSEVPTYPAGKRGKNPRPRRARESAYTHRKARCNPLLPTSRRFSAKSLTAPSLRAQGFVKKHSSVVDGAAVVVADGNLPPEGLLEVSRLCARRGVPLVFEPTSVAKCSAPFSTGVSEDCALVVCQLRVWFSFSPSLTKRAVVALPWHVLVTLSCRGEVNLVLSRKGKCGDRFRPATPSCSVRRDTVS